MPARPLLVGAMNPCPCGWLGEKQRICTCAPPRVQSYRGRVSGPLLDRFDLQVALAAIDVGHVTDLPPGEGSAVVRARVVAARERAARRGGTSPSLPELLEDASAPARQLLERAGDRLGLSMRAFVRALRVARTIAHLDGQEHIEIAHVAEALQYRLPDPSVPEAQRSPSA